MTKQYIQIIRAEGWYALFDGDHMQRLVCIALFKAPDGSTGVEGLVARDWLECPEEEKGFLCYIHESELALKQTSTDKATLSVGESESGWKHVGYFDRGNA